ncbi:hypothetical protein BK121_02450 [Paenibacillus odorifer]|uniref:hypothetical protein n=1 Tax=Paenibacillus odorifer TaxID=189426 RepID=UPI00096E2EAA|nr:hypothetical protein [Paenibacillus odorifer]OMC74905.1 hypothetical protein BK121_02450 [Paenibacillus odorifer]
MKKIIIGGVMGLTILLFFFFILRHNNQSLEVKPDIMFPTTEYRVTDSSAPGLPILITAEGADVIKIQATSGNLLLWNPPDYKVHNKGLELKIKSGDQIYWSPMDGENKQRDEPQDTKITVMAYHNNKQIGTSIVEIHKNDLGVYTGEIPEVK